MRTRALSTLEIAIRRLVLQFLLVAAWGWVFLPATDVWAQAHPFSCQQLQACESGAPGGTWPRCGCPRPDDCSVPWLYECSFDITGQPSEMTNWEWPTVWNCGCLAPGGDWIEPQPGQSCANACIEPGTGTGVFPNCECPACEPCPIGWEHPDPFSCTCWPGSILPTE
jgi:hypothetical protein